MVLYMLGEAICPDINHRTCESSPVKRWFISWSVIPTLWMVNDGDEDRGEGGVDGKEGEENESGSDSM